MEDMRIFIRNMLQSVFKVKVQNPQDISYPIISAVGSVENAIDRMKKVDEEKISGPIVDAQNATTEAIKAIPEVKIPEIDLSSLESKLDALKTAFESKEMTVSVGGTKVDVDTKSIVSAIKNLEKLLKKEPKEKAQEVYDYTEILSKILDVMTAPKDTEDMRMMHELVGKLGTTEDLSVLADWLKVIAEKEVEQVPFSFSKGRLKVEVDRVGGGGGGGLTTIESSAIQSVATETTLSGISTKVDALTTPSDTQPISAVSLPLPAGASTSDNQTNGTQRVRLLDGSGNAINSLHGAINIHDADVHQEPMNHFFYKELESYTLASPIASQDSQMVVTDATGILVGDYIHLTDTANNNHEHDLLRVTVVSGTTITFNRKVDKAYAVATSTVKRMTTNMNLSGTLALPQIFTVLPSPGEVWHITALDFAIIDNVEMDDAKFGGITELTNGVVIRQHDSVNNEYETFSAWRNNQSFALDGFDVDYPTKAPAGSYGYRGSMDIHKQYGSIVRLANTDTETIAMEVLIQDDLSTLTSFRIKIHGHIEG